MSWKINYNNNAEYAIYFDTIYPYFDKCKDRTVLEIGPFMGGHTQLIEALTPKSLTLVEANKHVISSLLENFSADIVYDDIFLYLEQPRPFDVVVCCGVLYHFHSPFYLLELIVNRVAPEIIYIETYPSTDITVTVENDNEPGARQLVNNWKSANISIKIPKDLIVSGMKNLGYKMTLEDSTLIKNNGKPVFYIFEKI